MSETEVIQNLKSRTNAKRQVKWTDKMHVSRQDYAQVCNEKTITKLSQSGLKLSCGQTVMRISRDNASLSTEQMPHTVTQSRQGRPRTKSTYAK